MLQILLFNMASIVTKWEVQSLQIEGSVLTNWSSFYKSGQPLLQIESGITNWGKTYYKLGKLLHIRLILTNTSITVLTATK